MNGREVLRLHEEVLLLALRDDKGTVAAGASYQYALGGAILAELLMSKRIGVESTSSKDLVELLDPTAIGDPLLDECLTTIRSSRRRASLKTWVSRFARIRDLKHRVATPLCDRGILRREEGRVLLVFPRTVYPERDARPEREVLERLRAAIFSDTREVEPRTAVLVSLVNAAEVLRLIFDKKKLKERKARIEQVVNGELTGRAAKEAIEAMQAAVMVACIVPTIVATTSTH